MSTDTSLVLFPTYGESQNMHVILQKIHDNMAFIALRVPTWEVGMHGKPANRVSPATLKIVYD